MKIYHLRRDQFLPLSLTEAWRLPLGWIGNLIHRFYVNAQLRTIFHYRRNALDKRFRKEINSNSVVS